MTEILTTDVITRQVTLAGLPALHIFAAAQLQQPTKLVINYHGWTNDNSEELVSAYQLVKHGFQVILPEAYLHGSRNDGTNLDHHPEHFWEIVGHSVLEFPKLVQAVIDAGWTTKDQIAVMGTSMGGITTCGIMATSAVPQAAVCLIGSPEPVAFAKDQIEQLPTKIADLFSEAQRTKVYQQIGQFDLSQHLDNLAGRPMFFFNGTADQMVPYKYVADFQELIQDQPAAKNLSFKKAEGGVHHVPHRVREYATEFLTKHC